MIVNIAPLRNVAAMISLIERLQQRELGLPGMSTFYGPSGWGKTSAVTFAANEFDAHVIEVQETWTKSFLAECILTELGVQNAEKIRGVPRKIAKICEVLRLSGKPLILDDAQYLLQQKMIGVVRDIYKGSQVPVILVGEEELPQALTKWENVHNRMLYWEAAQPCSVSDAHHLMDMHCAELDIADDLVEAIVDAAAGSIRRVVINLVRVRDFARRKGKKSMTMDEWHGRSFDTGQPPQRPKHQQSLTTQQVIPLDRKKVATR